LGALLNLGLCNEQLDRLATALRWFRKAQTHASELGVADYESVAKDAATVLATMVPTIKIALTRAAPAGAYVAIDGVRVDAVDYSRIELDAGRHVIELRGATVLNETIDLRDGDHQTVTVLVPASEVAKRVVEVDVGRGRRRAAYAVASGALALYGATIAIGLVGKSQYEAADRPSGWDPWRDIVRYGGTTTFTLATGAAATAIYLYVTAPRARRVEVPVVAPVVGPDRVGATIEGRF
jgi:hypothetical protein